MPEMFINFPQVVRRDASSAEFGREPGKWTLAFPLRNAASGAQVVVHNVGL